MRAIFVVITAVIFSVIVGGTAISTISARDNDPKVKRHADATVCFSDRLSSVSNEARDVLISGGSFVMGTNTGYTDEGPEQTREIQNLWIDRHEVTNAQFAAFVEATGYVTVAERGVDGVKGSAVFIAPSADTPMSAVSWWKFIEGASWRHPDGPGSSIADKEYYPVIHIALEDAKAYAAWAGRRLPTEEEWEFAARGGLGGATYEWGEEKPDDGAPKANTWQGMFPVINTKKDGFEGLAPTGCFKPNGFGLYDMTGNVWEWTSTAYYAQHASREQKPGDGHDPRQPGVPVNVVKGGSYLCAENYCVRYRPAARHPQDHNLGTSHIGFRTVRKSASID